MTGSKLRAAIIGCGKIGSSFADDPNREKLGVYSHAESYFLSERADLVAVCDVDADLVRACGGRWGCNKTYTDPMEMMANESLDLVSICTPDGTHFDIAMTVLKGAHLKGMLIEKPLSHDAASAKILIQMAADSGVKLAVNYSRRFSENFVKLRKFIGAGGIGSIQVVHGLYTKGLKHNGSHWVDLLRFLAGEVEAATVVTHDVPTEPDPTLDVIYRLGGGGEACLQGLSHHDYSLFEMDILGTKGRVKIEDSGHRFHVFEIVPSNWYAGYFTLEECPKQIEGGMRDVTMNAIENLIDAVQGRGELACPGEDGLRAIQLTDLLSG